MPARLTWWKPPVAWLVTWLVLLVLLIAGPVVAGNTAKTEVPLEIDLISAYRLAVKNNPVHCQKVLDLEYARLNLEHVRATQQGWGSEIAISEAEDRWQQAEFAVTISEKNLYLQVTAAYFHALAAEEKWRLSQRRSQTNQGSAWEETLIQREKERNEALMELNQVLGLDPEQAVQLKVSDLTFREMKLDEGLLVRRAMLADQEVMARRKELAVAQREVEMAVDKEKPSAEVKLLINRRAAAEMRLREAEAAVTFKIKKQVEEARRLAKLYQLKKKALAERGEALAYEEEMAVVDLLADYLVQLVSLEVLGGWIAG